MEEFALSSAPAGAMPVTAAGGATTVAPPFTVIDPALLPRMSVEELRGLHRELMGRLRDVEHWHRLVAARLDLAVAAVTDLDEPSVLAAPVTLPPCEDLHALLGIPRSEGRLAESGRLIGLRGALRELELTASSLHSQASCVGQELARRHTRVVVHLPHPRTGD
ncbi:MAG: hypothetical protein U0Q15_07770 [Kineosporiaceae bacterium]